MNKKRMKWIFFILTLTCFPVVLVYANGAPMPGANGYNTDSPAPSTNTGAPQPGANGYNPNSNNNIVPKQSYSYSPPNVQEAKAREAQQQKNKQDKKKKDEKKSKKMTITNLFNRKLKMLIKFSRTKMLLPRILKKLGKI